ncbi:MAG TPA: M20/M25/M40 family metallo-hydrolase [Terriglobales bacterium]|nr:M20/M25/M40 family metallo-hydrolase [Terriglobales bacterium]
MQTADLYAAAAIRKDVVQLAADPQVHSAFAWFRANQRQLSDLQLEVTNIPAPPFGEGRRGEWLRKHFVSYGLKDVHIDSLGNVIGVRPGADLKAKYVAITAHMDTVFPASTKIDARREGDRLYGPGISDNGAGLAAMLALISAMQSAKIRTQAPLAFIANVGEEGEGDVRGMRHLFSESPWRDRIGYTLVVDGAGSDSIINQALGSRRYLITVTGPGGHSWSDFGTPNPIIGLAKAIELFSRTPVPASPKTTFNIGSISGGTSVNSIPESASMKVDLRSTSAEELGRLEQSLRESLEVALHGVTKQPKSLANDQELTYQMELIGNRPAAELPPDARILAVVKAVDEHLGVNSKLQRASTDANIPLSQGREAIAMGAGGTGGGAHTLQEWYDPTAREVGLKRILLTVLTLSGYQPEGGKRGPNPVAASQ